MLFLSFSCEEPTLNVEVDDIISFVCPFYDAGFVVPPGENNKPLYENMYMVDSEDLYKSCNATGNVWEIF